MIDRYKIEEPSEFEELQSELETNELHSEFKIDRAKYLEWLTNNPEQNENDYQIAMVSEALRNAKELAEDYRKKEDPKLESTEGLRLQKRIRDLESILDIFEGLSA